MGNSQIFASLPPLGQAIQSAMRGNISENAGAIIEIMHKNPDMSVDEATVAARSLVRRERGACVLSGQTRRNGKSRRVAPIVEVTAGEADETGGFAAIAIDFTEPDYRIQMREIARFAMTEKGQDLIKRAEPLVQELDRLRAESGEAIADDNDVCRRQGFYLKQHRKEELENALARLRAHFEWCAENGVTELSPGSAKTSAKDFFDRAVQTGFDFGEGE